LDVNAWIEEEIEKKARDGAIDRRAKRDNISYGDAMIQLAEEIERPFQEIRTRNASKPVTLDLEREEERINRKAESYARRQGVSYEIALEAVLKEEVA
jgi:hypothetical protein